jgi:hypothetical protein
MSDPSDAGRDRMKNPSINFPQTEEEAFQALVHAARNALFHQTRRDGALTRTFTTDAGLGYTRTPQQAAWLNVQQSLLHARLEDFLDQLDLESRAA